MHYPEIVQRLLKCSCHIKKDIHHVVFLSDYQKAVLS